MISDGRVLCDGFTASSSKITTHCPHHVFKVLIIFILFTVLLFKCVIVKCLNFVIREKLPKIHEFLSPVTLGLPPSHLGGPMRVV